MTCIVAIEQDGIAYIGSDSFVGTEHVRDSIDKPKFFSKGKHFVIGFAGGLRGAQIIEHSVKFRRRRKGETAEHYLVTEVSHKLREAFSQEGVNIQQAGQSDTHDTDFIVCIDGKIHLIQGDYSVVRSRHGFIAIGAGQDFALGALATVEEDLTPEEKITKALGVAAEFSPQVCGPFHVTEV